MNDERKDLGLDVGDKVELEGRFAGEYVIIEINKMWGTWYYILEDRDGKTEDFPISYMRQYLKSSNSETKSNNNYCLHNWKEDRWFVNTYKTCTKCGAKYEEVYEKK